MKRPKKKLDLKNMDVKDLKNVKVQIKVPSVVERVARGRVSNRLAIVAALLVVGIVAVPMALSKSTSAPPAATAQLPPASTPPIEQMPAVTVSNTPSTAPLTGRSRNPFTQPAVKTAASKGTTTSNSQSSSTGTESSSSSSSSGSSSPSTSTTTKPSTSPSGGTVTSPSKPPAPSVTPVNPNKPQAPVGQLTATQAYYVTFSMTTKSGGLETIPSVQRLAPLPSRREPLMLELGVLHGGKRVLFALQPGAVIRGSGTCVPGPLDCQVLSIGRGQIEKLSVRTQAGISEVAYFSITSIAARKYNSKAAASTARRSQSDFGHELLRENGGAALSLFEFDPGLGVLVDKRNLTVGS